MRDNLFVVRVALIVALGGFLMGFDASVISGVNRFIEIEFGLSEIQLGWAVASLTLSATAAMLIAGPLSDRIGRRRVLTIAAILYAISAIGSALAPSFTVLWVARMVGGLGVGASLIIAPMYIAEISPAHLRGRMVSFNQLNIVIGISVAFFTNYAILQLGQSDAAWAQSLKFDEYNWRWMLGLETLPAVLYFVGLFFVPRSPRWLIMKGAFDEALGVMTKATNAETAATQLQTIRQSIEDEGHQPRASLLRQLDQLFKPALKLVLTIGIVIAILQQITGINSVFFYAPMIFEQSGIGTDASFMQAVLVGLVNLVFTVLAILLIDKLGRKPLLMIGVAGIAISMTVLAYGFSKATYTLTPEAITNMSEDVPAEALASIAGTTFNSDLDYKNTLIDLMGEEDFKAHQSTLLTAATDVNAMLILICILGFVASFAISVGPVMWVLFSELFPNYIRGLAISFVGLINSAVSFVVQFIFPWELAHLGSSVTFLIYGVLALLGLIFIVRVVPETKGKSLEELETILVKN
ncbi:MAG: sugar porter family MFS transporter [Saprospiraceae bacterium]|nr:sugar porter family MFS transporter [Saprospiraceae bacterium]